MHMLKNRLLLSTSLVLNTLLTLWVGLVSYLSDETHIVESESGSDILVSFGMPALALLLFITTCILVSIIAVVSYRTVRKKYKTL